MAKEQTNYFDHLVEKQKARARAVENLQKIAKEYPDIFTEVARCFLKALLPQEEAAEVLEIEEEKLSPTEAVLGWLDEYHQGTPNKIVSDLIEKIETVSTKPRAILYSTLASLRARRVVKVIKNKDGNKVYVRTG